ncbi:unnamed protein product [Rotaria sordida]|uniref:EGF-like domain-containing protein n=1 Tax=Rotaria sordida TaxID=392033 RepID=A0A814SLN1_9BILA|nr:unnamed protein product [Rotaria sordida]
MDKVIVVCRGPIMIWLTLIDNCTSAGSSSTACRNNLCENGSSCESVPGGGYRCICRSGFTGMFCAYPIAG